jgi:TetR/AcrR family transcriptional repressor of lmrAB and yxaGH operons
MLQTTARVLQRRGYHGTAVSTVLDESEAPRGSLYFHFPGGKDQMVVEATRLAVAKVSAALRKSFEDAVDPARGVRDYAELAAKLMEESDFTFGCPVAGLILDAGEEVPELASICREALDEWSSVTVASLKSAGMPIGRARALALVVQAGIEGGLILARAHRDARLLRTLGLELEAIVRAALRRAARSARKKKSPRRARR